jgi:CHAT domain-containing protein/tetratricopeptide (TPR) repeat protein
MVLLCCLLGQAVAAQCPDFQKIYQNVSQPLDPLIDDKGLQLQQKQLTTWHKQWQKCGAKPDSTFGLLLQRLGVVASWQGQTSSSVEWYKKAITVFSKLGQDTRISSIPKANYLVGECYLLNNEYTKALPVFEQILKLPIQPATVVFKINSYLQLAYIQADFGDYERALKLLTFGAQLAQKYQNTPLIIRLNYQKAYILRRLNRYKEAIDITRVVIQLAQKAQLTDDLIKNFESLGTMYAADEKPDSALFFYKKALFLAQQTKRPIPNQIYNNIGYMYQLSRKPDDALNYYQKALLVEKDVYHRALVIHNIGVIDAQKKRHKEALIRFQEAFNTMAFDKPLKTIEDNPKASSIRKSIRKQYVLLIIQDKADTWLDYSKTPAGGKNALKNALRTYALADSMIDFMRYEHAGEGSKLFWRQKTRGMYERAIEAAYLAGDSEMAFRFFEKSKSVLLADKLNELGANQQLSEADTRRQRALRDSIANLQNQLAALPATDKKRTVLQNRLEQFNDDFAAFRKNLETTNPAYYRYKYDNSTPTVAGFTSSLSPQTAFVSYFVGDSAVYAFTLHDQAKLIRLKIKPSDYQALANEFLNLCANRATLNAQYPRYRALAYALYEQLWKPLNISTERVVIAQDGVFLPFEAFLTQPNGNDFLLKKHAVSYTYSAKYLQKSSNVPNASFWSNLKRQTSNIQSPFVGFAPETFAVGLKQVPLSGSAAVLQEVGKDFWFGKKLVNAEASKANFLRHAPNARVIQLFTHAEADSTEATEPKIYFQDAALRLSELNQAEGFGAQLLVLSACQTGVGANQRGEGVFSLARGFAALGIPSTITTLWRVEDQPTYELTKLFYKYLHQNLPKDVALQRAKLDWLAAGGAADALPSQWAGMILVGDAAPLSSPFGIPTLSFVIPTIGWAAIAAILCLLILLWRRRK